MEKVVVGVKKTSFKTKDTNETIEGYNIFCTYEDKNVQGVAAERLFLSMNKVGEWKPAPGDVIRVYYNQFGKVDSVELL